MSGWVIVTHAAHAKRKMLFTRLPSCVVCPQVLFELARYHAPSTIFLDELESVMSQRGSSLG